MNQSIFSNIEVFATKNKNNYQPSNKKTKENKSSQHYRHFTGTTEKQEQNNNKNSILFYLKYTFIKSTRYIQIYLLSYLFIIKIHDERKRNNMENSEQNYN